MERCAAGSVKAADSSYACSWRMRRSQASQSLPFIEPASLPAKPLAAHEPVKRLLGNASWHLQAAIMAAYSFVLVQAASYSKPPCIIKEI